MFETTAAVSVTPQGQGVLWANWSGVVSPLQEGSTYTICAYGRYTIDGIPARDTGSCFDADQTGRPASTTIDRTKPSIAVRIDGGAPFSRTAKLDYNIDYADNLGSRSRRTSSAATWAAPRRRRAPASRTRTTRRAASRWVA